MTVNSNYRYPEGAISPARHAFAITPSDTEITQQLKGIYVGGAGNVTLRAKDSPSDVTFVAVPAGAILDVDPAFIRASSTATSMIGLA